jgi:3-hydroxybutyryl-CoA dehydrogenase
MAMVSESEVRRVAVIGAGVMGSGIAQVAALAGLEVTMQDITEKALRTGLDRVRDHLEGGVTRGKLDAAARDAALGRISTTIKLADAAANADMVIEAVPEDLELKRLTFVDIAAAAPERALLASNTSSLPIGEIAGDLAGRERLVGMHFFNPVHIMKLVEIVRPEGASNEAVELARALAVRMGKQPIVVKDVPGFATSRLGVLLGLEAIRMVEEGVASPADIDRAMVLGYGHPMGPLELGDLVGLDVRLGIAEHLGRTIGPAFNPPELLRRMVAEGKLGQKRGQGFYKWDGGKKKE